MGTAGQKIFQKNRDTNKTKHDYFTEVFDLVDIAFLGDTLKTQGPGVSVRTSEDG